MSMFAGAMGAGMAASAIGSVISAASQNRAARRAQDVTRSDQAAQQRMLGSLMLGPQNYYNLMLANHDRSGIRWAGLGDPHYRDPTQAQYAQGSSDFYSQFPSMQDVLKSSGNRYISDLEGNLGQEQQHTRQLDQLASQAEGWGSDLQGQQDAVTRRDAARQLQGMNQQSIAQLGYLGPSTLTANQLSGNAAAVGRQTNDALLASAQAAIQRLLQARGARMSQLGQRYGLEGQLQQNLAGARQNNALAPSQQLQQLLQGQAFQPQQANAAAYSPYSPLGNALGSIGPGLTALGSFGMAGGFGGGAGNSAVGAYNGSLGNGGISSGLNQFNAQQFGGGGFRYT